MPFDRLSHCRIRLKELFKLLFDLVIPSKKIKRVSESEREKKYLCTLSSYTKASTQTLLPFTVWERLININKNRGEMVIRGSFSSWIDR